MSAQASSIRYVPESALDFSRRAKHLAWLTKRPLQRCQELLAQAYGYSGAHELRSLIGQTHESPGFPGNVDLEYSVGERMLSRLASGSGPEFLRTLSNREWLARDIGLTSPWPSHKRDFERIKASLLIEEGAETPDLVGSSPLDYGRAYRTGYGDYTIALTPVGRALCDVLYRWDEDERHVETASHFDDHMDGLVARHPHNPWAIAYRTIEIASSLIRSGLGKEDDWHRVLQGAERSIALFERIISMEQAAKYAGAKLLSQANGYGNEAYYFPTVLFDAGVAAHELGHLDAAIRYFERAYMMDTRDGAGARFSLLDAYAERDGHAKAPAHWDPLVFAHVLRATTLLDAGDFEGAVRALVHALMGRLWQSFNNGYSGAPGTLTGVLRSAAPVSVGRADAWRQLNEIAKHPGVQACVKPAVSAAKRIEHVDLEYDVPRLADEVLACLNG